MIPVALGIVLPVLLAVVFSAAALGKLTDLAGTRDGLAGFGVPDSLVAPAALTLPAAELAVAVMLLFGATRAAGAAGALSLLAVFSVTIVANLARGRTPDCHCFGRLHSAPAGASTVARNAVLAACATAVLAAGTGAPHADAFAWIGTLGLAELLALAAALAAVGLAAAGGVAFLSLMRSQGRLLMQVDSLRRSLEAAGIDVEPEQTLVELGRDPGTPAPEVAAETATGQRISLADLLEPGLPLLLTFTSPGCGPCAALLPVLSRWQQEHAASLSFATISADSAAYDAYQVTGTPSAVLISADGQIASYLAEGAEAIELLLEGALRGDGDTQGPADRRARTVAGPARLRRPGGGPGRPRGTRHARVVLEPGLRLLQCDAERPACLGGQRRPRCAAPARRLIGRSRAVSSRWLSLGRGTGHGLRRGRGLRCRRHADGGARRRRWPHRVRTRDRGRSGTGTRGHAPSHLGRPTRRATAMSRQSLDDLARTLAEPMPRRRALRFAGAALVASVLPGLRPRGALADGCGPDTHCSDACTADGDIGACGTESRNACGQIICRLRAASAPARNVARGPTNRGSATRTIAAGRPTARTASRAPRNANAARPAARATSSAPRATASCAAGMARTHAWCRARRRASVARRASSAAPTWTGPSAAALLRRVRAGSASARKG